MRAAALWAGLAAAILVPLAVAATSPLLQWRGPIYVAAGLAGVLALGVMLAQPLLAAGLLPGLGARDGRRVHAVLGLALLALVAAHVAGLWITSPPDMVDAMLWRSPTPFTGWGVAALYALALAAPVALSRRRLPPRLWRPLHTGLVATAAVGTALHALLIEGTMGQVSKAALCAAVLGATGWAALRLRSWAGLRRAR